MEKLVEPLVRAGTDGVKLKCGDGYYRHCYPILAAYIADNPEQTMIAGCRKNLCYECLVDRDERGDWIICCARHHKHTACALHAQQLGIPQSSLQQTDSNLSANLFGLIYLTVTFMVA